jgi:hypothetical protein
MTLSTTQAAILAAAARHPDHAPPAKLAPAPREAIRKSLLFFRFSECDPMIQR